MIRCILGERKIGKSVYVENYVKEQDEKALYIATLPPIKLYQEIINIHRKRRPLTWECIELFQMSIDEILTFPYQGFRNVILDNLSYYVLFQMQTRKETFIHECDGRIFSLIDKFAADKNTTVHFVDTPIQTEILVLQDENRIIRRLFDDILEKAVVIERYHSKDIIFPMTIEGAKIYFFTNEEEKT